MAVTTETVAPREVEFTIEPQPERVEEALRQAARKVAKRVRIPGFRPGKAPYALVERTVGKELLTEEAASILAPDLYKQVLSEGGYQPYAQPSLRITRQEPLEMKIRVPLEPSVELADYCAMKVEPEPAPQVTPEQEEKLLGELRERQGSWVPAERAAQLGDQVTLDIKGTSEGNSIFDEKGTQLTLSETLSPPGLAEAIAGMEPGQTRDFTLTYPENYFQETVRGKKVDFTMTLRELKERQLPALDDEFAHSVGEYATLDELKARLREGLQAQAKSEAEDKLAARVLDQVVKESKIEYPNLAAEQEIDRMIRQRENRLRQQGFTLESFLRTTHKSMAQLRDEMRSEAEEALRRSLVLTEVARAEKIEVTPEELASEVDRLAASFGEQAEAVRQAFTREGALAPVLSDLYTRKSLTRLVDVVTGKVEGACRAKPGEEVEAPAAEAPAQPSAEEQKP